MGNRSEVPTNHAVVQHAVGIVEQLRGQINQYPDNGAWIVSISSVRELAVEIADAVVAAMEELRNCEGHNPYVTGVQVKNNRDNPDFSVITASVAQL